MSNKKRSKTNITKISATSNDVTNSATTKSAPRPSLNDQNSRQSTKKSHKTNKNSSEKPLKDVFLLARPFVAFGRYLRDSWREIRQVRWPNRKLTWKMTLAVLIYCAIFIVFIVLLDMLFTFIFNLLINAK